MQQANPEGNQFNAPPSESKEDLDFESIPRKLIEKYVEQTMKTELDKARNMDPRAILADGVNKQDYTKQVPTSLKPEKYATDDTIAAVRAMDPNQSTPRFDVSKQFTDING
jgi:hypothetical protein